MGFFALGVIRPDDRAGALSERRLCSKLLAAGIAVGILIVPLVASVAEDAMHAVPVRSVRPRTGSARAGGR